MNTIPKILTLTCIALLLGMSFVLAPAQAQPYAYVTDSGCQTLSVINTDNNIVTGNSIQVGNIPRGLALTPDGDFIYVANFGPAGLGISTVSVINVSERNVMKAVRVEAGPDDIAITPDGKYVYVTTVFDKISVISTATNTVETTISLPAGSSPGGIAFTPDGSYAYVANFKSNNVSVMNIKNNNTIDATIGVGRQPTEIAITPDGKFAYVTNHGSASVSVIDITTRTVNKTFTVGTRPFGIAISPDGKFAYVTNVGPNALGPDHVSVIDIATGTVNKTAFTVGTDPFGITLTPDGKFAYVANRLSHNLSVINIENNKVEHIPVGSAPWDVAIGSKEHTAATYDVVRSLDPGTADVNLTEGPTDSRYVRPLGKKTAVMVFVDFPASFTLTTQSLENMKSEKLPDDVYQKLKIETIENKKFTSWDGFEKALKQTIGDEQTVEYKSLILKHADIPKELPPTHLNTVDMSTSAVGQEKLGHGEVEKLFREQSYGKMKLEVTSIDGWARMPKTSKEYTVGDGVFTWEEHKTYIADALTRPEFAGVNFTAYDMVFIVAAPTPKDSETGSRELGNIRKVGNISLSPAYVRTQGNIEVGGSSLALSVVTFGNDSYTNRFINLVHEMGHVFGLPDLYPYSGFSSETVVGPWDLMDNIFQGNTFFGWHRHKMGWLDPLRKKYLKQGEWSGILTPLSSYCGTSMVVIPVGRADKPSKVFVVELTEPVLKESSSTETSNSEGVLIYSVDATIQSGHHPVKVYSKSLSDLWQAPYTKGDEFDHPDSPMKVEVVRKVDRGYELKIIVKDESLPPQRESVEGVVLTFTQIDDKVEVYLNGSSTPAWTYGLLRYNEPPVTWSVPLVSGKTNTIEVKAFNRIGSATLHGSVEFRYSDGSRIEERKWTIQPNYNVARDPEPFEHYKVNIPH